MGNRILRAWTFVLGIAAPFSLAAAPSNISKVSVSQASFNPSLSQTVGISFTLAKPGLLDLLILDRDGYPVRRLVTAKKTERGPVTFNWNGRDDKGQIVPDEAYSLSIELSGSGRDIAHYLPASVRPKEWTLRPRYFDRRSGILAYTLPAASRVHLQAGTATVDEQTKTITGPVLKTIVNREPRPAGAVVEHWDGFDDTGSVQIPELPNFGIAIAATALPENSIIAFGNKKADFLTYALARTGSTLLKAVQTSHQHHRGLSTLEDVAPELRLTLQGSVESNGHVWTVNSPHAELLVSLQGPSAEAFAREPGSIQIFLDGKPVREIADPKPDMRLSISLQPEKPQPMVLAVNWASEYGPVAVAVMRVSVAKRSATRSGPSTGD